MEEEEIIEEEEEEIEEEEIITEEAIESPDNTTRYKSKVNLLLTELIFNC